MDLFVPIYFGLWNLKHTSMCVTGTQTRMEDLWEEKTIRFLTL